MRNFRKKILNLVFIAFAIGMSIPLNRQTTIVQAYDIVNPSVYYAELSSTKTGAAFRNEIYQLMDSTHKTYTSYDSLKDAYKIADVNPDDSSQVELFYTGEYRKFVDFGGRIDREHVWPNSKGVGTAGPGSDAHHLRPADSTINSGRGNAGFGPGGFTPPNIIFGGPAARIVFYVGAHYGPESSYNLTIIEDVNGGTTSHGSLSKLLEWNLKYPVTASEIRRNNSVQTIQGNRNPFIDHPEYACRIWGSTNSETQRVCAETQPVVIQPATQNVIDLIAAIGTVTLSSESKIVSAEQAYNSLSSEQKELIYSNHQQLIIARANYNSLVAIGSMDGKGALKIERSSFGSGSLAYANASPWTAITSKGETMNGTAHLFSNTTQFEMQANTNNFALRNTSPLPGAITNITFNVANGSPRSLTIYASSTAEISDGNPSSGGINLGNFTPEGLLGDYTFSINPNNNYQYFYIHQTGGAAFYSYVTITYKDVSGPSPSELAAQYNARVNEALVEGVNAENASSVKAIIDDSLLLSAEVYGLINISALNQLSSLYNNYVNDSAAEFIARMETILCNITTNSDEEIDAIEHEYNGLTEDIKTLVDAAGYSNLLAQLRTAYQNFLDLSFAQQVIDMIAALPAIEAIQLQHASLIQEARASYNDLTSTQKSLVTNYYLLLAAEEKLNEIDPSASATEVYNKNTSTAKGSMAWSTILYGTGTKTLTDKLTIDGTDLEWLQNSGQYNGGVAYLGSNSNNVETMNISDSKFSSLQPTLDAVDDTNLRIAMLRMGNFYINKPTSVKFDWIGTSNAATGYLVASTNQGASWQILTTQAIKNGIAVPDTIEWSGLDYINTNGVQFALVATRSGDVTIRDVGFSAKALSNISTDYQVNITSISIDPSTLSLDVGQQENLTVNVLPENASDKNYTLVSSNPSVASVTSGGVVTAHSGGTATITATSTKNSAITAFCLVTVADLTCAYVPVRPTLGNVMLQMDRISFVQKMEGHTYVSLVAKGAQYGSASTTGVVEFESSLVTFAKEDLNKIVINMSTSASGNNSTLKVYLGDEQIGETIALSNVATEYSFIPTGISAKAGHLRIVAEGNGICFGGLYIYGGLANINAGLTGDMANVYNALRDANPCIDYINWQSFSDDLETLSEEQQEMVKNALYISASKTIEKIGDKLDYMKGLAAASQPDIAKSNPQLELGMTRESVMTTLGIVVIAGFATIIGYYFALKKKYC